MPLAFQDITETPVLVARSAADAITIQNQHRRNYVRIAVAADSEAAVDRDSPSFEIAPGGEKRVVFEDASQVLYAWFVRQAGPAVGPLRVLVQRETIP